MKHGRVFWFTGLAGSGKTTLASHFYSRLKEIHPQSVFLDGDYLREVFNGPDGFSLEARFNLAIKYSRLCQLLASQEIDVVCATISMFDKCREWNRTHLMHYFEIYIRVPLHVLLERDQKELYSRAMRGEISNVMGVDLPFEEPKNPDLILDNDGHVSLNTLSNEIFNCAFNEAR